MRALILALAIAAACKEKPHLSPSGVAEISVTAKGFEPARFDAAPGQQVTLRITRKVKDTCADAVEVEGDPVKHMLPLDVPVEVKVTVPQSGEVAFACPMHMYQGAIVVRR
jgi:plastocyanin domain-containing protein